MVTARQASIGIVPALASALTCAMRPTSVSAQDLPSDSQVQAAFAPLYDHLGLMEYCAAKGFVSAADVANTRRLVAITTRGLTIDASTRAQEAVGRHGEIIGEQIIGLSDASNPTRPELVPAGRTMSLAENARAQKTPERVLCGQMAAQVAPLP